MSGQPLVDNLPALIEAAAAVVGEIDLETVLRRLVSEARAATGARYAALGVIGDHGVLSDFIHEGLSDEEVAAIGALPSGRGVLGTVIREKRTIRVESISAHPDAHGFPPHHPPMSQFLGVPVSVGAQAFGNLYLTDKVGGFTDDDVTIVEALSRIAGSAVHTARLQSRLRRVAIVEDRERIARDLHDSVIQDLFAVGLGLQSVSERVDDPGSSAALDVAVDRLDSAVEALRDYIFQLKETSSARASFEDHLQEVVSRMGSAYPASVSLEIDVDESLTDVVEAEIVRLVTEALSNSLRHSGASEVEVVVTADGGTWGITVTDNGRGFDVRGTSKGLGLQNMRARATSLGGSYSLVTAPGKGTVVEVSGTIS